MRTTMKVVLPLILSVAVASLLFAAYKVRTERRRLRDELSMHAEILGASLQGKRGALDGQWFGEPAAVRRTF
jgi:hypothetical protein